MFKEGEVAIGDFNNFEGTVEDDGGRRGVSIDAAHGVFKVGGNLVA
jgi:hypothetical protein